MLLGRHLKRSSRMGYEHVPLGRLGGSGLEMGVKSGSGSGQRGGRMLVSGWRLLFGEREGMPRGTMLPQSFGSCANK